MFADVQLVRAPAANQALECGVEPFGVFYQRVGEIKRYGIIWDDWLANHWQPDTQATLTQPIRPTQANGFQYVCTNAGQSAGQEPAWPTSIGATVLDGQVEWTCEAIDTSALAATVSSSAWTAPTPVTSSGAALSAQTATVLVDTTAGVAGTDYDIPNTIHTSDGQTAIGKIRIKVR